MWRLDEPAKSKGSRLKIIAKTLEGLEQVLADEIRELGGDDIQILKRAVLCTGNQAFLYKANLWLRTCLKLLVYVKEFQIRNETDLYNQIKAMPWDSWMDVDDTFAIDSVVSSTMFRHANFISLKTKDAIADMFREKKGRRPNVDTKDPTLRIHIHIRENVVTVALDSSGPSLHLRGYRKQQVEAPLNEVLAAGMILLSGWDKEIPFYDPMCGSGTLLCEAALLAANKPPQSLERRFAFLNWKDFDGPLWKKICADTLVEKKKDKKQFISGSDSNRKAVSIAIDNCNAAGLGDIIHFEHLDFFYHEGLSDAFLVFNPPYDARLKEKDIVQFYKNIGDKLKLSFSGCTAWILSGHEEAIKHLGLRPSRKIRLLNGSIPSLFCRYDLYAGSKKAKWQNLNESADV